MLRSPPLKAAQRVAEQRSKGDTLVLRSPPLKALSGLLSGTQRRDACVAVSPLKAAQRVAEQRSKGRCACVAVSAFEGRSAGC